MGTARKGREKKKRDLNVPAAVSSREISSSAGQPSPPESHPAEPEGSEWHTVSAQAKVNFAGGGWCPGDPANRVWASDRGLLQERHGVVVSEDTIRVQHDRNSGRLRAASCHLVLCFFGRGLFLLFFLPLPFSSSFSPSAPSVISRCGQPGKPAVADQGRVAFALLQQGGQVLDQTGANQAWESRTGEGRAG